MPQGLGLFLPPSCGCLDFLDDVVGWTALLIYTICPLDGVKNSFSQRSPLLFVLTLLLGETLDVARYGQYGGKLHL
jgi:hypothetical protein